MQLHLAFGIESVIIMTSTATWRNYITMREAVNTRRIRFSIS